MTAICVHLCLSAAVVQNSLKIRISTEPKKKLKDKRPWLDAQRTLFYLFSGIFFSS
jgi:hypothetical protein